MNWELAMAAVVGLVIVWVAQDWVVGVVLGVVTTNDTTARVETMLASKITNGLLGAILAVLLFR
jgi:hypothetical protein